MPGLRARFPAATIVEGDALELDWRALGGPGASWSPATSPTTSPRRCIDKALDAAAPAAHRLPGAEGSGRPGDGAARASRPMARSASGCRRWPGPSGSSPCPAGAFHPRPKVDSAVLRLTPLEPPLVADAEQPTLPPARGRAVRLSPEAARAAGSASSPAGTPDRVGEALERARRSTRRARPEMLAPAAFVRLQRALVDGGWHGAVAL